MNKSQPSSSGVLFEAILLAVEVLASAGKVSLASARRLASLAGRFMGYSAVGALVLLALFGLGIATGTAWLAMSAFILLGATVAAYAFVFAALLRAGDALLPDGFELSTLLRGGGKLVEWLLLAVFLLAVALYLLPEASWLSGLLFLGLMGLTYRMERRGPDPRWLRVKVIGLFGIPLAAAVVTHFAEVRMPAATQSLKKSATAFDATVSNWVNDTLRAPQRVPADTLEQFDATPFFDQDGKPRLWIYQPAEGPCELYATAGTHPYHGTALAPATPGLRDACRAALTAQLQQQKRAAQDEIRRKEQAAAERLRQEKEAADQQRQRQEAAEAERDQLQQQAAASARLRQQAIEAAERYAQAQTAQQQRPMQVPTTGAPQHREPTPEADTHSSEPSSDDDKVAALYEAFAINLVARRVFNVSEEAFKEKYSISCTAIKEQRYKIDEYRIDKEFVAVTATFDLSDRNISMAKPGMGAKSYQVAWTTDANLYRGISSRETIASVSHELAHQLEEETN